MGQPLNAEANHGCMKPYQIQDIPFGKEKKMMIHASFANVFNLFENFRIFFYFET